jgi:hypothetical protein
VAVEVRDSLGVRIVTYSQLDSTSTAIAVDSLPRFVVGWSPGGRLFERIMDMAVLGDGRIAVLDGGATQQVVLLSPQGVVEEVLGGRGQGPGEFQQLSAVVAVGTAGFATQDWMSARITVFEEGKPVSTSSVPTQDHKSVFAVEGGRALMGPPLIVVQGRLYPEAWRRVALTSTDLGTMVEDTVAVVDWDQSLNFNGRDPWSSSGFAGYFNGRFVVGRGDEPELRWLDLAGEVRQTVRWRSPPRAVPDGALAAHVESYRSSRSQLDPAFVQDMVDQVVEQHRGLTPYFDEFRVDRAGRVWIGEFLHPTDVQPQRQRLYFVFSESGEALGAVGLPSTFRFRGVADEFVIGYEVGPFGEQAVVAYDLTWDTGS